MPNAGFLSSRIICGALFCPEGISMDLLKNSFEREELTSAFSRNKYVIFPGFADVHVHLREPGFSYKETVYTGTSAAARGGFTSVCAMPNLNPVPDCYDNLKYETDIIQRDAVIGVYPYGSITKGQKGTELSDMDSLSGHVCGFTDDGYGVEDGELMLNAMKKAKSLGKLIANHCEYKSLVGAGYIHNGEYAKSRNIKGMAGESEWWMLERDLNLAAKTGCAYHACHISTKESVSLIRQAKAAGLDISCEVTPHHLLLDDTVLKDEGRYKMNPPLRSKSDREALLKGLADGTIDMIATDHAPHGESEKDMGLEKSAFGVTGLEIAFPVLYTRLVKANIISLDKLIDLMCHSPRKRFGLHRNDNDFTVFDLNAGYVINPNEFASMGKSTPFAGDTVYGKCMATYYNGRFVWLSPELKDGLQP